MSAGTMSETREHPVERATVDEAFRARLLADPKATIAEEPDLTIPSDFTIAVHEETAGTGHLVLPPLAALSEGDLEQAEGGSDGPGYWTREVWYFNEMVFIPTD